MAPVITKGNLRTVRKATLEAARFAAAGAEASTVLGGTQGTLALHLLTFDLPLLHRRLPTCTRTDDETNERRPSGSKAGTENWTPRAFEQNTAVLEGSRRLVSTCTGYMTCLGVCATYLS